MSSTDTAPADELPPLTPEEVAAVLADLKVQYGNWGVHPLRIGASIMIDGAVYEARDLREATDAERAVIKARCFFCDRTYGGDSPEASERDLVGRHVDLHGVRARHEMHLWAFFHKDVGLFSNGQRMEDP